MRMRLVISGSERSALTPKLRDFCEMALCRVTFTRVVVGIAVAVLAYYCFFIYLIFNPPQCKREQRQRCLTSAYGSDTTLQLWIYTSPTLSASNTKQLEIILHKTDFHRHQELTEEVNVTLPDSTHRNGSLYAHIFLGPEGKSPLHRNDRQYMSVVSVPVTRYAVPEATAYSLLTTMSENATDDNRPVTHWIPWLKIHTLKDDWKFDRYSVPYEFMRVLHFFPGTLEYLPILYVDRLRVTKRDLKLISKENTTMKLEVSYEPVGIGKLRLWMMFAESMERMKTFGFSDKDLEDVRGIFLGTNLWLLGLTFFISFFHMLFDFLAFKNDISFWRGRKTTVGISTRRILWRCFSHVVVFLYLMDEKTSLLVLVPAGIAAVIEFWKVKKAFKVKVKWSGWTPHLERGERLEVELQTELYDSEAMRYLSYVLCPLVIAGAAYQLLYSRYKSWYSWVIHCLVNGVYAFGFLFMLPQLFLNYKLKSVAHLPWKVFMYKAFSTFIDDVFAFIITMPTSHRIAVFRDDLVFLVYLYQRWLYPVDKARVNEFGESFEEPKKHQD